MHEKLGFSEGLDVNPGSRNFFILEIENSHFCIVEQIELFVEEIIYQYANQTAYVSLLIPASILSDKTCMKLRSHILKDSRLLTVKGCLIYRTALIFV